MRILLISLLLSFSVHSNANSDYFFKTDKSVKSCPSKAEPLAKEFLLIEEKGRRVYQGKSSCITGTTLKYLKSSRAIGDNVESGVTRAPFIVVKKGSMKIESIREISKETLEYEVKFSAVNAKTKKAIKDSFNFMASSLAKGNKKPSFGCGHLAEYPLKTYISEECI